MPSAYLNLLGPFRLTAATGEIILPRKAQGLVTLLAMQRGQLMERETAADFLWQRSGAEQARQSLRQSLLVLRRQLGPDAIASEGAVLKLDASVIAVDAIEFTGLADSRDREQLARCAELYRGTFVDNLSITSRFDEWVAIERQRLAELATNALHRLATICAESGEFEVAVRTARRVVAIDDLNEAGHRLLIAMLARSGRRAEALRHYTSCVETLRRELGVAPSAETAALGGSLKAADRAAVTAEQSAALAPAPAPRPSPPFAPTGDGNPRGVGGPLAFRKPALARFVWAALASAAVLVSAIVLGGAPGLSPPPPEVVVLPLQSLAETADQDGAIAGLGDVIADELAKTYSLRVVHYRGSDLRPLRKRADAAPEVRYIVEGAAVFGSRLRIETTARSRHGAAIWSQRFEAPVPQSLHLAEDIAGEVYHAIGRDAAVIRGAEEPATLLDPGQSREIYALAEQIRRTPSRFANAEAQRAVVRALAIEPANPDALALLANTHVTRYSLQRFSALPDAERITDEAFALTRRALALDPSNARALWDECHLHRVQQRLDAAMDACRRALRVNPEYAAALRDTGYILLESGKPAEAIPWFREAIGASPTNPFRGAAWLGLGVSEVLLDHAGDAIAPLHDSISADFPGNAAGLWLSAALDLAGRHREAMAAIDDFRTRHPEIANGDPWLGRMVAFAAERPRLIEAFHQIGVEDAAAASRSAR